MVIIFNIVKNRMNLIIKWICFYLIWVYLINKIDEVLIKIKYFVL